jgi:hypothetical protein
LIPSRRIGRHSGGLGCLLELKAPAVVVKKIGRLIVGDEKVDAAVVVDVGGDNPQAPPLMLKESRRFGDVGKPALVIAEDMVRAV